MSTNVGYVPCQRANMDTRKNLSWCVECSELIYKRCADFHVRFKMSCEHTLLEVTEKEASEIVAAVMPQFCESHAQEPICYFCEDHKAMCCKMCVILNHEKCKNKKDTDILGKALKDGNRSEDLFHWVQKLEQKIKGLKLGLNRSLNVLKDREVAFLADIKERRNKINSVIDTFEQGAINAFGAKRKDIETRINLDIKTLTETQSEANRLATVLAVNKDKATDTQFLLASNEVKKKRTNLDAKVNGLANSGIKILEWKLVNLRLDKVLPVQNTEIVVNEKPFQTEIESFTVTVERTKDKKPFFVDVVMLGDGRLLVLDQTQSLLRLLTNNQEHSAQKQITNAKHIAALNKDIVVVSLNESKTLKFLKLTGADIVHNGEIKIDAECFGLSKYRNSAILLCTTGKNEEKFGIEPSEIKFKLLGVDKELLDFNFPVMDTISSWRGFVFDEHSDRFVAISKDGASLIWFDRAGQTIQEKKFDSIGSGGLSGLAVDCEGRLYTAATRKLFEIANTGQIVGTFPATINIYSIAVSEMGDKLIAVGHNASLEVFMINHIN